MGTFKRYYLWLKQNGRCKTCGRKCKWEPGKNGRQYKDLFTIDHILPQMLGGMNSKENLQGLCFTCNNTKGCKII